MMLSGVWHGWEIDDEVLISPSGKSITPEMIEWLLPTTVNQAQLSVLLGVSRAAITGRINRKTLPPFDGDGKTWKYETISHILKN